MNSVRNYVFTWACGQKYFENKDFHIFLKSFNKLRFAHLVVFSDEFHDNWQEKLHNMNHDTCVAKHVYFLLRDRWYYYAKTLYQLNAKYVLLCDSKDVVFQDDPFKIISDLGIKGEFAIFCEEGMDHGDSLWNGNDQFKYQVNVASEWKRDFLSKPVINGGFVLGTPKKLAQLSTLIWTNMISNPNPPCSDQAAINFLYQWIEQDPEIHLLNPLSHNLCLVGQGIVEKKIYCLLKAGKFCNLSGDPYYAFHQWDRTDWASFLRKKYYD